MLALREEPSLNIAAQHEANATYMFSREFFVAWERTIRDVYTYLVQFSRE